VRLSILSACLILVGARFVAAEPRYDVQREIAWACHRWAIDLEGVRFGTPTKKLLAWVPAGGSIEAWAFSPSHECDRIELRRDGDELVGESIVYKGVSQGRELRAWKVFAFGDVFAEGAEALRSETRDADGTWQPAGQTGTIGRENTTFGALSYVDAAVARFGGTHLVLYAECAGPIEWLTCRSGGERPCIACQKISVTPVEANAYYDGLGFALGRRQPSCKERCPQRPPNPAVARVDELQSHVTIWQPSGEPLNETPSLHRTLAHCMRTHYPNHTIRATP
jgi:hypothetical protein